MYIINKPCPLREYAVRVVRCVRPGHGHRSLSSTCGQVRVTIFRYQSVRAYRVGQCFSNSRAVELYRLIPVESGFDKCEHWIIKLFDSLRKCMDWIDRPSAPPLHSRVMSTNVFIILYPVFHVVWPHTQINFSCTSCTNGLTAPTTNCEHNTIPIRPTTSSRGVRIIFAYPTTGLRLENDCRFDLVFYDYVVLSHTL